MNQMIQDKIVFVWIEATLAPLTIDGNDIEIRSHSKDYNKFFCWRTDRFEIVIPKID